MVSQSNVCQLIIVRVLHTNLILNYIRCLTNFRQSVLLNGCFKFLSLSLKFHPIFFWIEVKFEMTITTINNEVTISYLSIIWSILVNFFNIIDLTLAPTIFVVVVVRIHSLSPYIFKFNDYNHWPLIHLQTMDVIEHFLLYILIYTAQFTTCWIVYNW